MSGTIKSCLFNLIIKIFQVKLEDRKSCNACRYKECMRNGMRPHLVLSEDQIQERFKNLPKLKQREKLMNSRKKPKVLANNERFLKSILDAYSINLINFRHSQITEDNREEQERIILDHSAISQGSYTPNYNNGCSSPYLHTYLPGKNIQGDYPISRHRQAHIGQQKSVIMLANRETSDQKGDYERTTPEEIQDGHIKMFSQKRNFIRYTGSYNENEENEVDKMLLNTMNSIDIKEIENMYTVEEQSYIMFMGHKFCKKWSEVNIGPKVMLDYIAFCKKQGPLKKEMFRMVKKATKERFTRMVETTDEFQYLNTHDKFFLLKNNLEYADIVDIIRKLSFHQAFPEDDPFDSWGSDDRVMLDKLGLKLHQESMTEVLQKMPFDERLKQEFISLLSQCQLPILADPHVLSLMVVIVIFSVGEIQLMER